MFKLIQFFCLCGLFELGTRSQGLCSTEHKLVLILAGSSRCYQNMYDQEVKMNSIS